MKILRCDGYESCRLPCDPHGCYTDIHGRNLGIPFRFITVIWIMNLLYGIINRRACLPDYQILLLLSTRPS